MPEYTSPIEVEPNIFELFVALRVKQFVQRGRLATAAHTLFVAERVGYDVPEVLRIVAKELGLKARRGDET